MDETGGGQGTGGAPDSPPVVATLVAALRNEELGAAFAPGTEDLRAAVAQRLVAAIPAIQAYVAERTARLDAELPEELRQALQADQDASVEAGTRLLARWVATGEAADHDAYQQVAFVGRRMAAIGGGFERVLRGTLATLDAFVAVLVDACRAEGASEAVVRGLRTGALVGNAQAALQSVRLFDDRARTLAEALQREQARLADLASMDPVTGSQNRRGLYGYLERLGHGSVGDAEQRTFALFFVDLDHFKQLNDRFGHRVGDAVLRVSAERLRAIARPTDCVARFGGDELVVAMADLPPGPTVAGEVAERIVNALRSPIQVGGTQVQVTASVGVAVGQGNLDKPDALLSAADDAMYEAKRAGRNRWRLVACS
ncbi:diguanylate cyclase domain-containing protein [Aciditerrimonas ferrireducens]|uniref:Diguanylate cyclase domain-containing protein n=1 Tax=Aciditerrimonas ferrireducens TaxID=667306 RepID=A0ABV6C3V2_9ACTN